MPDDAITRIRQIIADHCFGPHDTKAAYERALEIAAACTDDMVDEGLLTAALASPAAPADDGAVIERMAKALYDFHWRGPGAALEWEKWEHRPGHEQAAWCDKARAALAALREADHG
jgi:hypothetical protein